MRENRKFQLQESEYCFPYHYLVSLDERGVFRLQKKLSWGLDYMTYMSYVCHLVRQRRPDSLLDIGCGDGRLIHMVQSDIPRVAGVDLSRRAIAFARAFNPDVTFTCGDIASVPDRYASVTLIEVLEHVPDTAMAVFLRSVARVVQDDGWLLISVPTANVPLTKKHYRHYDREQLEATLSPYFEIEQCAWLYRRCFWERRFRALLCNSFCLLNASFLLRWIWRLHKRLTYHANANNGAHLVCVARPKRQQRRRSSVSP